MSLPRRVLNGGLLAVMAAAAAGYPSVALAGTGPITEYAAPTTASEPHDIALGPDGNMWFTEYAARRVAKITPAGAITEYLIPTPGANPAGIVAGPDGNLWFTEYSANKVAKITTAGVIKEYIVPSPGGNPTAITAGPDGNLWFTEFGGINGVNKVAKITTAGVFTEYPIPTNNSGPQGIVTGPDGNLWITESNANKIAKVTTAGVFTEYNIPTASSQSEGIAVGPDGNLWFAEFGTSKVAKVTTAGVFTEYPTPTAASGPSRIAAGADGNVWFTENLAGQLAETTTAGAVQEYPIPTSASAPIGLAQDPLGNMWFAEDATNQVGKAAYLAPTPAVTGISPASGPTSGGTSVTINGSGLSFATSVKFGTTAATITSNTSTQIVAVAPAEAQSSVDVTVTTAGGTSAATSADVFNFVAPAPVVTSIAPTSGALGGGASVTIQGTGLSFATAVNFGTTPATGITSNSDTQLVAVSPAGSVGTTVDVTVTTAGGTSSTSAADRFTYVPYGPCTGATISPSPASPHNNSGTVVITGTAIGPCAPTYRFWMRKPGGKWHIVQDYSTTSTFQWNIAAIATGGYSLEVDVRNNGSAAVYDAVANTTYTIVTGYTPCNAATLSLNPVSGSGFTGGAVVMTGSTATCPHPLYRFWVRDPGSAWSIVQNYSSTATHTWGPAGTYHVGRYGMEVDVKDAASTASYDIVQTITYNLGGCTGATISATPSSAAHGAASIVLSATASCPGTPTYRFWVKDPGSRWSMVQDYSTNASYTWAAAHQPLAGVYSIEVDVRDLGSFDTYEFHTSGATYTMS